MIPVTTFAGKTIAVFGLGASGNVTAQALLAGGARVSAWDDGAAGREGAAKLGIPLEDLSTADWSKFAALVLAPGVPLTHPEPHWVVLKARTAGVEVIGDIELFCRERNKLCPEAPFIAITGTNGKSTTTALIAHIMREAGHDVQMGGNIGRPILDLAPLKADRFYVIEMSSFQIDLTPSANPTVGVLLNITPDHLDRHGPADDLDLAMKNYVAIKERLVANSIEAAVIGIDDNWCRAIAERLGTLAIPISTHSQTLALGCVATGRVLTWRSNGTVRATWDLTEATALRGEHNSQNAAAAVAVAGQFPIEMLTIQRAFVTYPGLPHRMEEIGRVGNVLFINDSKATNADSTEKALLTFPRDVYWVLGGKPKEGGITTLEKYFPGIIKAYLIGAATEEFARTLEGKVPYERCGTLDVAVQRAAADAASLSSPGTGEDVPQGQVRGFGATSEPASSPSSAPVSASRCSAATGHLLPSGEKRGTPVVLLSPACASYDQFKNFEVRGEAFRALVSALPGFVPRGSDPAALADAAVRREKERGGPK